MNSKAHAFHPNSDSFEDRLFELRSVLDDLARAKKSLSYTDERLGTQQEKLDAVAIFENSLSVALTAFNEREVDALQESDLLSKEGIIHLKSAERVRRLRNQRTSFSDHSTTQKR